MTRVRREEPAGRDSVKERLGIPSEDQVKVLEDSSADPAARG